MTSMNAMPGLAAGNLPEFRLETYFSRWEFAARHHLTASDAQTRSVGELLALGTEDQRAEFEALPLGYIPTWGTERLRRAIASTYSRCSADDVLVFAGAEEALFWVLQVFLGPGDHAVVTVPNYQSLEAVPLAAGADVTGLLLDEGAGWAPDLDAFRAALRPTTRVVAVNFPNNPTGAVPDGDTWTSVVRDCEERGILLVADEVYRGLEVDPSRRLTQAADLSGSALSLNVMSKAYGLPGLRVGWLACRDHALLERLERCKHYTSICNAAPSEFLAALALEHAETLLARNRSIISANLPLFDAFFAKHQDLFDWTPPQGGAVAFPRYRGDDGVEAFCQDLVETAGVLLLPASIYASQLAQVPADRFRIGVGRQDPSPALEALDAFLVNRRGQRD